MFGRLFREVPGRLIASTLMLSFSSLAQTHTPLLDPIPSPIPESGLQIALQPVASGFVAPTWATFAPGDDKHLYVADQPGQLWEVTLPKDGDNLDSQQASSPSPRLLLDLSNIVVKVGLFPPLNYDERGFLSIVFHPRFRQNGLLYTFTSEMVNGKADFSTLPVGLAPNCQTVIREWHATERHDDGDEHGWENQRRQNPGDHANGISIDPSSSRVLLRIDKPQFNHNGGSLAFGPDSLLYISLGDGGNANDVGHGHVPGGNAQSLAMNNVLGKILRIDPAGWNAANGQYGIPLSNPFAWTNGGPGEVWAYGFRNPFRMSFDSQTGMLIAGDVGQNNIEEVDVVRKGGNYGWPTKEGTFLFDNGSSRPAPNTNTGFVYANSPGMPAGLTDPIAEYDHADGPPPAPEVRVAVVGGYVYHGQNVHNLRGRYIFGDYSGEIGTAANGHIFTLVNGTVENIRVAGRSQLGMAVLSFGQDAHGELYLLANATGTLNGRTGQVLRIASIDIGHPDDNRGDDGRGQDRH